MSVCQGCFTRKPPNTSEYHCAAERELVWSRIGQTPPPPFEHLSDTSIRALTEAMTGGHPDLARFGREIFRGVEL